MIKRNSAPPDQVARNKALDTHASYIVQAPAGSGKTELLTHRFLKLLAEVDEPEEILAITFTRAATAEMRSRVLKALREVHDNPTAQTDESAMLGSARAALAHARNRAWRILEQPQRLNIQTIDSLCMRIANEQPMLARMGGNLQPQDDARAFYDLAAHRTLSHLGGTDRELNTALLHLLQLRDNNLGDCETLIAAMLAQRDQWLDKFPTPGQLTEEDWDAVRLLLEAPFKLAIQRTLVQAHRLLTSEQIVADELIKLASYACSNPNENDIGLLATLQRIPAPEDTFLEHWRCICNLLLTKTSEWRKSFTKSEGFPPGSAKSEEGIKKEAIKDLINRLRRIPGLLQLLGEIRSLPPAHYDEDQWQTLRHLFIILRHAYAELRVIFAEQNAVDFTELNLAASLVLEQEHPTERALAVSERIRHLLVDEFQDTSRRQHRLLAMLLRAWNPGDGRTCFFVGDPMQSIYMFRQAEVELFEQVKLHGIESGEQAHACTSLQLSANFRSHAGLTEPLNDQFEKIFAGSVASGAAAVSFSRSEAIAPSLPDPSVCLHPQFVLSKGRKPELQDSIKAQQQEANVVLSIVEQHLPRITTAIIDPDDSFTVAILARARQHLALIAHELRKQDIPFRSVELETLAERQEIRDLLSLTRALLHPMDRIAWLSVLRAPWCGLSLRDLHLLCGDDDKQFAFLAVSQLIEQRMSLLSEDGQLRLQRVTVSLIRSLETRYSNTSLSSWIERTWHSLGGPLCLNEEQQQNARVFFTMLDTIDPDGITCLSDNFDVLLSRLFAQPDPRASERAGVQLMTIHKAKGLGFDVVIVPGLDRATRREAHPLISMLERVGIDDPTKDELLLAPIGAKGGETHPLFRWVRKQREMREAEERKRLFYVACTRARRELHLLGTAVVSQGAVLRVSEKDSLLNAAWPALEEEFNAMYLQHTQQDVLPFPAPAENVILKLAAAAEPQHPTRALRRLPAAVTFPIPASNVTVASTISIPSDPDATFERPEGTRLQRITGSIIHRLLEQLSARLANPTASTSDVQSYLRTSAENMLRAAALPPDGFAGILTAVEAVANDPTGRWILGSHTKAQSEASWTGWIDGTLHTLRADRIFQAGAKPHDEGEEYFWVIDYKTSYYSGTNMASFIAAERERYAPQLSQYGRALRKMHGESTRLQYGLYFPRLHHLEHWEG